jgi:hypothetical protein
MQSCFRSSFAQLVPAAILPESQVEYNSVFPGNNCECPCACSGSLGPLHFKLGLVLWIGPIVVLIPIGSMTCMMKQNNEATCMSEYLSVFTVFSWHMLHLMISLDRSMATGETSVWIKIERPGTKRARSTQISCSKDTNLDSLIALALLRLPEATKGLDALSLEPQDADGKELPIDMKVSELLVFLGQSSNQPLRLVCNTSLEGEVLLST